MRHVPLALAAALLLAPAPAPAAEPGGAFVMTMGRDTLALERFERAGGGTRATLLFRVTRMLVHWRTVTDAGGGVRRLDADVRVAGEPLDGPPKQSFTAEFTGDSVLVEATPGGPKRLGTSRGAWPFLNPSMVLIADFATHVMPAPGGTRTADLFLLGGASTVTATVSRPAADSVVVAFAGVSFCLRLDAQGDVVRGRVPEQNLDIVRVAALPPELLALAAPDYSAPADAPYTAENVIVPARGGRVLAGTLVRPVRSAPAPCVVLVTGSGQQDRDESLAILPGYRPFREIADALARRGVATLRLDDRGIGGSSGPVRGATTADFADDVADALAWLRARPDLDGARLGLAGHSEGGLIAPLVAVRDPRVRAVALLAGPAWTGRRILEYQNGRAIERAVAPAGRDSARAAARAAVDSLAASDAWLGWFVRHDPLPVIRRVRQPVLILQGATDRQVSAEQADELARALAAAGNRAVTKRVLAARNHLFLPDPDGDPSGYSQLPVRELGPEVTAPLAEWFSRVLGTPAVSAGPRGAGSPANRK